MEFDIFINGCKYRFNKAINVEQLVNFLNCNKNAIAIEYNHQILQKDLWSKTIINSNDNLELVTIVGGG